MVCVKIWLHSFFIDPRDGINLIRSLLYPNVEKVEALHSLIAEGKVGIGYRKPLATPDMKRSGFPEGEKRCHPIGPILKGTIG